MIKNKLDDADQFAVEEVAMKGKNKISITQKGTKDKNEIVFDMNDVKDLQPSFFTRVLLILMPQWGIARLARELGYPSRDFAKKLHSIFEQVRRIDILPLRGDWRGFQFVLNNTVSFYFYQDDDCFVYDGFELGEYEAGEVTIFDKK